MPASARGGRFSISILTEDSDPALIGTFGFHSSRDTDKFKDIRFEMQDGLPIIQDASGFIICKLIDTMETATHTIFLGEITAMEAIRPGTPMTYSYYHKVIKGKSPKNAPTYQPQEEADAGSSIRWKCMICGYICRRRSAARRLQVSDLRCRRRHVRKDHHIDPYRDDPDEATVRIIPAFVSIRLFPQEGMRNA